eukprot:gene8119-16663_t
MAEYGYEEEHNELKTLALQSLAEIETLEKELGFTYDDPISFSFYNENCTDISIITPASEVKNKQSAVDYSFELAGAESDREFFQDRNNELQHRNEELEERHRRDLEIIEEYKRKLSNEEELRRQLRQAIEERDVAIGERYLLQKQQLSAEAVAVQESKAIQSLQAELQEQRRKYDDIEFKLAQAKCALASSQQSQEDFLMAQELAEKERDQERVVRLLAEKERDAYASAYGASLKQFPRPLAFASLKGKALNLYTPQFKYPRHHANALFKAVVAVHKITSTDFCFVIYYTPRSLAKELRKNTIRYQPENAKIVGFKDR